MRRAFAVELRDGQIQDVEALTGHSILSVVGDGMAGTPGIAADVFGALAGAGVNVRAIAQGSSERNISVVIDARQTTRALRSVHARFYLSPHTDLDRPGRPGRRGQRAARADRLAGAAPAARFPARSARARGDDVEEDAAVGSVDRHRRLEATSWRPGQPVDLERFEDHVHADHLPHAVIIDCSASETVAALYPRWLAEGIHVVTPNKRANSGRSTCSRSVQRGAPGRRVALPLRGHGRRRAADHADAARPARDRRRDPQGRGHLLRHAGLSLQRVGRQRAVLVDRQDGQGEGLHRAGPARRPLGHRRGAQAGDSGARDGHAARARRTWRSRG